MHRLIKYGGFNRVLFLVDRNNSATEHCALQRLHDPDDGRKFTDLYNVDKLTGEHRFQQGDDLHHPTSVLCSTWQRNL